MQGVLLKLYLSCLTLIGKQHPFPLELAQVVVFAGLEGLSFSHLGWAFTQLLARAYEWRGTIGHVALSCWIFDGDVFTRPYRC